MKIKRLPFLIAIAALSYLINFGILTYVTPGTIKFIYYMAIDRIQSSHSSWNWFYCAVLFGKPIGSTGGEFSQAFKELGIFHLVVVSGTHVQALSQFFSVLLFFLPKNITRPLVTFKIFLYCWANCFSPPCTRAFVSQTLGFLNPRASMFPIYFTLLTFLTSLLFQPKWFESLSFELSMVCCLALVLVHHLEFKSKIVNSFWATVFCTGLGYPLILQMQHCLSWLSIPLNLLLKPLFDLFIVPVFFISFLIPVLKPYCDKFLDVFKLSLLYLYHHFKGPPICMESRNLQHWKGFYFLCLFFVAAVIVPKIKRARLKNSL